MHDETWIDGRVDDDYNAVTEDGAKYSIPSREYEDGSLKAGDRIQFVPGRRRWRGKLWTRKLLLRP